MPSCILKLLEFKKTSQNDKEKMLIFLILLVATHTSMRYFTSIIIKMFASKSFQKVLLVVLNTVFLTFFRKSYKLFFLTSYHIWAAFSTPRWPASASEGSVLRRHFHHRCEQHPACTRLHYPRHMTSPGRKNYNQSVLTDGLLVHSMFLDLVPVSPNTFLFFPKNIVKNVFFVKFGTIIKMLSGHTKKINFYLK